MKSKSCQFICVMLIALFGFSGAMPTMAAPYLDASIVEWFEVNIDDALVAYPDQYGISINLDLGEINVVTWEPLENEITTALKRFGIDMGIVGVTALPVPKPKDYPTDDNRSTAKSSVSVRSGPGASFKKLGKLKKGQQISIVSVNEDWAEIEYSEGYGFVSLNYLIPYHGKEAYAPIIGVAIEDTDIRSGASTKHKITSGFSKGDSVIVLQIRKGWAEVSYGFANWRTGYIPLKNLSFNIDGVNRIF